MVTHVFFGITFATAERMIMTVSSMKEESRLFVVNIIEIKHEL